MKTRLFVLLTLSLFALLPVSCDDDDTGTDVREKFIGDWEGDCDYLCPDILEEERIIGFDIAEGVNENELILDIEFRFEVTDPNSIKEAENVVAVVTDNGFQIVGQTVAFGSSDVFISGEGSINDGELEFSLEIPLALTTCNLAGTVQRD